MCSGSLQHRAKRLMQCSIVLGVVYSSKHKEKLTMAKEQGKADRHMNWSGHNRFCRGGTDAHRILALHRSNVSQR